MLYDLILGNTSLYLHLLVQLLYNISTSHPVLLSGSLILGILQNLSLTRLTVQQVISHSANHKNLLIGFSLKLGNFREISIRSIGPGKRGHPGLRPLKINGGIGGGVAFGLLAPINLRIATLGYRPGISSHQITNNTIIAINFLRLLRVAEDLPKRKIHGIFQRYML